MILRVSNYVSRCLTFKPWSWNRSLVSLCPRMMNVLEIAHLIVSCSQFARQLWTSLGNGKKESFLVNNWEGSQSQAAERLSFELACSDFFPFPLLCVSEQKLVKPSTCDIFCSSCPHVDWYLATNCFKAFICSHSKYVSGRRPVWGFLMFRRGKCWHTSVITLMDNFINCSEWPK